MGTDKTSFEYFYQPQSLCIKCVCICMYVYAYTYGYKSVPYVNTYVTRYEWVLFMFNKYIFSLTCFGDLTKLVHRN